MHERIAAEILSRDARPDPTDAFHPYPSLGAICRCFAPHFCLAFHHFYPDDEGELPKYTRMYVYSRSAQCLVCFGIAFAAGFVAPFVVGFSCG